MSIRIKGLSKVTSNLKKFGVDGTNVIKKELDISATNIQQNASARAPAGWDNDRTLQYEPLNIKQRIDKIPSNGGLRWEIGIQADKLNKFDIYFEFGTGLSADQILSDPKYTSKILALARAYFINGDGTIIGQPYLFPAFFEESPKLIENLKSELTKLAKKV